MCMEVRHFVYICESACIYIYILSNLASNLSLGILASMIQGSNTE